MLRRVALVLTRAVTILCVTAEIQTTTFLKSVTVRSVSKHCDPPPSAIPSNLAESCADMSVLCPRPCVSNGPFRPFIVSIETPHNICPLILIIITIIIISILRSFVESWPLLHFLNCKHSSQDSLDRGSALRKVCSYTPANTDTA
jgi:hypothetical protein